TGQDRPPPQASGRSTAAGDAPLLFQLQLPGRLMEQAATSGGQGRVAPRRALSARRLHRHQPGAAGRARRCLLQPPRHLRAVHQRRQGRDQVDPPVVPLLRCKRRPPPAPRVGLYLGNVMRTLAMPKTAEPWSLTSLREKLIKIGAKVVSHGRYVTFQMAEVAVPRQMFQEILSLVALLRAPPAPA